MTATAKTRSLADLAPLPDDVRKWRILLIVSAVNSLTQRVATYLSDLGCDKVSIEVAVSDEAMLTAVLNHSPHVVIAPFLVKKVPEIIYNNVVTLIVHPGPPGDAGPAALDWVLLGDRGIDADEATALASLVQPVDLALPLAHRQRTHWGVTVLQADNTFDGGPVWAFDQFPLPDVTQTTKSALYQGQVTSAAIRAVTVALTRISKAYAALPDPSHRASRVAVPVDPKWAAECVSSGVPFMGGALHDRPQIKPASRRPDFGVHTAADVARIINCGDSQPGGTFKTARSFIFAYNAKIHQRITDLPADLIRESGHASWDTIPAGTAIATRHGAVLFKTRDCGHGPQCAHGCGIAVWLTHGRLPKGNKDAALPAKIPMADALRLAGEGERLVAVPEWEERSFEEAPGTYQQVFVRSVMEGDAVIQFVYWDFYNGAFCTTGCAHLVRVLQWASDPARGNVKILALMGGTYFSNGVALNIIESAEHPGRETWANINGIDDVVEFLAGDLSSVPRSDFLAGVPSLIERGITTVACLRGNAAAGGVALAAACDIVVSAGSVVLNPAYRAMGLHGSEFHLYSYVTRCGRSVATHMVKDMLPLSAMRARELGLVDFVVSDRDAAVAASTNLLVDYVRSLATAPASSYGNTKFCSAPWTHTPATPSSSAPTTTLVGRLCANKRQLYESPSHTPLVNYRHEELSQMLLDSFHPRRSQRYHTRRIKFVRKVKGESTPTRFCKHRLHAKLDEEEEAAFDAAPGWVRGEEWSWVGLQTPTSMATSESLLIDFAAPVPALLDRRVSSASSSSEPSADICTDRGSEIDPAVVGSPSSQPHSTSGHFLEVTPPLAMSKRISMLPSKPKAPVFHEPVERAAHPLNPRLNRSTDALSLSTITMHASRSQTNLATPNKRRNFLGKLAGAFRSRADLKETTRIDKAPVVGGSASVKGAPSIRARTPAYDRPVIPNEGDTESPCLYNVTTVQFDRASVRSARPQQPQVISV